jgi:hypothetical protein
MFQSIPGPIPNKKTEVRNLRGMLKHSWKPNTICKCWEHKKKLENNAKDGTKILLKY